MIEKNKRKWARKKCCRKKKEKWSENLRKNLFVEKKRKFSFYKFKWMLNRKSRIFNMNQRITFLALLLALGMVVGDQDEDIPHNE